MLAVRLCTEILRQQPTFEVYLVSLYDPTPSVVYDEALASGVKIVTLGKKKGFDPKTFLRMYKTLRSIKPDVIHTHLAGLRYAIPATAFLKRTVKVHTVHNMAAHETSGLMLHLHKFAFRHLGWQPVALSNEVKKSIRNVYGLDSPIVMNGIRVNDMLRKESKKKLRTMCRIPTDRFIIITIGRLWKQKNHVLLIEAFNKVFNIVNSATLLIVGEDPTDGAFRRFLESKINSLPKGANKNIFLLGQRNDIAELLLASNVFVLSSDWEGVPLTLLEAMGYGTPVVCTSVGGIPDVIKDKSEGLLIKKGDCDGLAEAILRVFSNKQMAANLSEKASDKFRREYSIDITAKNYIKLYGR